jgi:hypothetical protein
MTLHIKTIIYIFILYIHNRTFLHDVRTEIVVDDLNVTIDHDKENFSFIQIRTQNVLLGRGY